MAVNATAVWRVRPSGSNTNGGGYDASIASAGTDYSRQNSAQLSNIGTVTSATTTLTDTGAAFTSVLIGNALWMSGTGVTTGFYFITAVPSGTTLTLDRSAGATGSVITYHIGGGWADFWTNTTANIVPGNIIYILGSGTPNSSSYTYDYTAAQFSPVSGDHTNGPVVFANDPSTPGYVAPPGMGGMPCIKTAGGITWNNIQGIALKGLWIVAAGASNGAYGVFRVTGGGTCNNAVIGCVYDQFGFDMCFSGQDSAEILFIGSEFFSSATAAAGSNYMFGGAGGIGAACKIYGCNIHNTIAGGAYFLRQYGGVINSIISKCNGNAIYATIGIQTDYMPIINNTIDGNTGNGIELDAIATVGTVQINNNIISNHTGGGKSGLVIDAGTSAANSRAALFIDYNVYYNNTADVTAISYGAHDTHGGSNPYVGQSTENYALA